MTQQLARNIFMSLEERTDPSFTRKIKEAALAVALTRVYSKDYIMELYLNQTYYGHRAYGIGAASRTYFGKKASDINLGLRRREGITQIDLAKQLGVSPSYLNLIESNRRPLTAQLLLELAKIFHLDLASFAAADDEARNAADLLEVLSDPMFEKHGITNADVREICASSPNVSRALLTLYRSYVDARTSSRADVAASQLVGDPRSHYATSLPTC